jgi:hypothetical protein
VFCFASSQGTTPPDSLSTLPFSATHAACGFENMPTRKRPSQRNYSGFLDEIASHLSRGAGVSRARQRSIRQMTQDRLKHFGRRDRLV